MAKVLVQGAPVKLTGHYKTRHCEFTANLIGDDHPGDFDIVVDVHRTSTLSRHFPKERRYFATNESPLYVPYFSDLENVSHLSSYYTGILTNDVFLLGWPMSMYANLHYRWATPRSSEDKVFGVSAIFSAKSGLQNYELRHTILAEQERITIPRLIIGPGGQRKCYPLQCSWDHCSKDSTFEYMFTIAIENCCAPGYFTEKIIDAFATKTVPVYLGCSDIGKHFDEDGVIKLDPDRWVEQLNSLTYDDYYSRLYAIRKNFDLASRYENFFTAMDAALYENGVVCGEGWV